MGTSCMSSLIFRLVQLVQIDIIIIEGGPPRATPKWRPCPQTQRKQQSKIKNHQLRVIDDRPFRKIIVPKLKCILSYCTLSM